MPFKNMLGWLVPVDASSYELPDAVLPCLGLVQSLLSPHSRETKPACLNQHLQRLV